MNIGIDLDGVLFDTEAMYRAYSVIYNAKNCHKRELDQEEILAQQRYEWSNEEFVNFADSCLVYIQTNAPLMYYSKQILIELQKSGHKLYVITSRGSLSDKEITITKERFKQENLNFEKIIFNAKDKLEYCKELKIDLMIDDNFRHIKKLSENGIKCLYYRDLVVKPCKHENVVEVRNWGEIFLQLVNLGALNVENINI